MADEDISPEEKLQIAQHFLVNAPPGQFGAVLEDVKVVVGGETVSGEALSGIAREFNSRNNRVLRDGDHPPLVLSKWGEQGGKYLEPKSKQLFEVDHLAMKIVGSPTPAADGADEASRAALEAALEAYVAERFVEGTAACAVYAGPAAGTLSCVITGEKLNLRNFWSGMWTSTWTVTLGAVPSVSGEIKLRAHYFEQGNVQLQTKKAIASASLAKGGGGPGAMAAAVASHVFAEEAVLMEGLEAMYANMTDETFKAMRRVMPVHRNKMNWNINEVKLNANLRK